MPDIFSSQPWVFYAGGVLPKDWETRPAIPLLKTLFPGNCFVQLRFPAFFIHGFEGKDFGAISLHYTDKAEAHAVGIGEDAIMSKDVMKALTTLLPQERLYIAQTLEGRELEQAIKAQHLKQAVLHS